MLVFKEKYYVNLKLNTIQINRIYGKECETKVANIRTTTVQEKNS
jgi:hypothetical protein